MSENGKVSTFSFEESGSIPNNPNCPVILVQGAMDPGAGDLAGDFESQFRDNGWGGCWRWGVYPFHHYHSNAHEALGVARGSAQLHLGGPDGERVSVTAGDLVILPAGTGHKCLSASDDFQVVGAYPPGQSDYDLVKEDTEPGDEIRERIRKVPVPDRDPLGCGSGWIQKYW